MAKGIGWLGLVIGMLLVTGMASGSADEVSSSGRQVVSKWQNAVVTVQVVVKTTMSMTGETPDKKEDKVECTGAIIDPSGLTVVALSAVNPAEVFSRVMYEAMSDVKMSSDITDVKLLLPDGQSLAGAVVLRDKDLDLAFIRPKQKPASPLPAVDLSTASTPQVLDETVTLYRLGTVGSRAIAACVDRIQSIIEKPRTLYAQGMDTMGASLGSPVFAIDGSPVGILVIRTLPGASSSSALSSGMGSRGIMYVVLPAGDVAEAAKQAPMSAPAAAAPTPAKPATPTKASTPAKKPAPAK